MPERSVTLVWAQANGGVLGRDNTIPWRVPEDMAHFKNVTMGLPVVMGRRTWESLPPSVRPLPGRRNIVVTSAPDTIDGAETADSVAAALALCEGDVCVMGGGQVYAAAMEHATRLVVTHVDLDVDGDVYAPPLTADWSLASDDGWRESAHGGTRYRIAHYHRA
ncbi:dihydrofolate reductase [Rhodococcus sp. HNM0569]|uniref:dihydrofolate reductase n=1 Tax=Rhodococcus sp. HNM0569 TaxID=2716340 RepID=UPI00146CA034|nr:dihydrofolate reductase [Rhodococcus sp. HNM0569]NLU82538.1 dihydrofolate reductase [Rhodococcus sp. HNM0569]